MRYSSLLLFTLSIVNAQDIARQLVDAMNEERVKAGLSKIAYSSKLTKVAQSHCENMAQYAPGTSDIHSWFGPLACDFNNNPDCMWSKAKSVGGYNGKGYEISLKGNVGGGAKGMIQGWLGSEAHRAVILSTGIWQSMKWSAVGGGQKGDFATMWFGSEADEGGDNNPQQPQSQSQPEQTPQGQPQGQSQPEQIPPQQSQGQSQPQQVPPQQPQGQLQPEKIPHGQPQPEQIPQQQPQGQSRPSPITPPGNDFGSFKPIFDSISNNMGRPSVPNFRPNSPNFGQSGQRNIPDMNQFFNSPSFNKFQQGGTNIPNQISPSFNGNGQGFNNLQQSSFFSP